MNRASISRRRLLGWAGGALASSAKGFPMMAAPAVAAASVPKTAQAGLTFLLLGDLHFDRIPQHDMDWLRREKPGDIRQIENYSRITGQILPGLLAELKERIREEKNLSLVAHIGDFVEGLAGTPELALRQAHDAVAFWQDGGLNRPLLFCKGNHDITGPGAQTAFDQVLMPYVARQWDGIPTDKTCFVVRPGNDTLFAFYDGYRRDSLDWLEKTLERRTERTLFVVIHQPVVPYDARSNWHIFASAHEQTERERLLRVLGRNRAIVLCGHLHKYGTVVRQTSEGSFIQLSTISVIPEAAVAAKDVVTGVAAYGPDLVRLEPQFSPQTEDERRRLLRSEAPFIRYFDYADAPGYSVIRVTPDGKASADLYLGLGKRLWKTLPLSDLMT